MSNCCTPTVFGVPPVQAVTADGEPIPGFASARLVFVIGHPDPKLFVPGAPGGRHWVYVWTRDGWRESSLGPVEFAQVERRLSSVDAAIFVPAS